MGVQPFGSDVFFEGGVHLANNCLGCKILPWDSSQSVITHVTNRHLMLAGSFGPVGEPSFLAGGIGSQILSRNFEVKTLGA